MYSILKYLYKYGYYVYFFIRDTEDSGGQIFDLKLHIKIAQKTIARVNIIYSIE